MAQLAQLNRMNPFGVNIGVVNLGAVGISLAGAAVLLQVNSHSLGLVSVRASAGSVGCRATLIACAAAPRGPEAAGLALGGDAVGGEGGATVRRRFRRRSC